MGWIDTHSHLQVEAFEPDLSERLAGARALGLEASVICAAGPSNWEATVRCARRVREPYMLGIHPLWLAGTTEKTLRDLRRLAEASLPDPLFVGIGEAGLDGLVPEGCTPWAEAVFAGQLKIARDLGLPLSVHARKSVSRILYWVRRIPAAGVVHAFNGSVAEREALLRLGFRLGFGGAATYAGSLRIRRHLKDTPADRYVLETDAPDMPGAARRDAFALGEGELLTDPSDILFAAKTAAGLRGVPLSRVEAETRANALAAFPRLEGALERRGA